MILCEIYLCTIVYYMREIFTCYIYIIEEQAEERVINYIVETWASDT
jgi:hypothetical protein